MATVHTLLDGPRKLIIRVTNKGTAESLVTIVDKSTLVGPDPGIAPGRLLVEEAQWTVQGYSAVELFWDHTTDDPMLRLGGEGFFYYKDYGGIVDPDSAGGTGDILLSTVGTPSGTETYDIILVLRKKQ